MLVLFNIPRLHYWFRVTLNVSRCEPRNRNRSTITMVPCTLVGLRKVDLCVNLLTY